jgi:TfoX/Sxy family transcriptional regulator of competence genes
MAYDESLANRVRQILARRSDIEERRMFGGLAFMARGHMCCGLVKDKLMVRVDPDAYERLLGAVGAQPMDFTGKPMRGFLDVTGEGIATTPGLRAWVKRSLDFVESRPPKTAGGSAAKSTRGLQSARRRPRNPPKEPGKRSGVIRG